MNEEHDIHEPNTVSKEIRERTEAAIKKLEEQGYKLNCPYARQLEGQTDESGEKVEGSTYWLKLETDYDESSPMHFREGKMFVPENPSGKLVCLYSGTPGVGIGTMEKRYANQLVQSGYTVWIPRHNGLKVEEKVMTKATGAPERVADAIALGEENTASRINGFSDFLDEPAADLPIFARQDNIDDITVIGHSCGVTSVISSLIKLQEQGHTATLDKISKFIGLSGYIGDGTVPTTADEMIGGTHFTLQDLVDAEYDSMSPVYSINGNPPADEVKRDYYQNIIAKTESFFAPENRLPENMQLLLDMSPTDKYMTPDSGSKYLDAQGHGLFITDLTHSGIAPEQITGEKDGIFGVDFEEATPDIIKAANEQSKERHGGSQHALANLRAETMLRLVELKIDDKSKHKVVLRSPEPSKTE